MMTTKPSEWAENMASTRSSVGVFGCLVGGRLEGDVLLVEEGREEREVGETVWIRGGRVGGVSRVSSRMKWPPPVLLPLLLVVALLEVEVVSREQSDSGDGMEEGGGGGGRGGATGW